MKKIVSAFAVTATASFLSSAAFAGSYQLGGTSYQTVSASCPTKTIGSETPVPGPVPAINDFRHDPKPAAGETPSLRVKTSTATFRWIPTDGFDTALPANYKVSHSYSVQANMSASSSNPAVDAMAGIGTLPTVPNKRYRVSGDGWGTPQVANWNATGTDVDFSYQPGEYGNIPIECVIGAKASTGMTQYPEIGGVATASSSVTVTTTGINLVTTP